MCGIVGYLSNNHAISESQIQEAATALKHRGPDGEGYFRDLNHGVALAHRRLSVLDLSNAASQPMYSHDKRYVMVYNGEVYNYALLRDRLIKEHDIQFHSTGDSEVILYAFICFGLEFVNLINGMFAIAIYDTMEDELWLFRDRMGIKPLYLYADDHVIAFSSELKTFNHLPNLVLDVNHFAISQYLNLGYIPAPHSIWGRIEKVLPGYYIKIDAKREISKEYYWRLEDQIEDRPITDETGAKSKVHTALRASVGKRLISDVPLGTFLSGGIDSSLVTALAIEQSSAPIETFNIGFDSDKHDESVYAEQIAKHLGSHHHTFRLSYDDMYETFEDYLLWFDEPFADSSAFPTYAVSKLAKSRLTVALTGDGGDELGFGYGSYTWAQRLSNPLTYQGRFLISSLMHLMPSTRWKRAAKVFQIPNRQSFYSHVFSQEQYLFSQNEITKLLNKPNFGKELSIDEKALNRKLISKELFSLLDLKYYLADDLLVKVDRTSMANGLECRVPFLDHEVVKLMLNIDQSLKMGALGSKHIFRSILYDYVPRSYFDRPKQGFSIPLQQWLKNELSEELKKAIHHLSDLGWINADYLTGIYQQWLGGNRLVYNRMWQLLALGKWIKLNS